MFFFSILVVFFTGFTLGITKLYHSIYNHKLGNITRTGMILFFSLFGDFDVEDFQANSYPEIETLGIIIFGVYLLIAVIILVNLFIAILSNTYAIIQEDSDMEWKYSRARLIDTYSLYTPVPPPFNLIECIIKACHCSKPTVVPYLENEDNLQKNEQQVTRSIVQLYNEQPLEVLTSTSITSLQLQINNLSNNIKTLTNIISISPLNTPKNTYQSDKNELNTKYYSMNE
jgi:hypothetical protein